MGKKKVTEPSCQACPYPWSVMEGCWKFEINRGCGLSIPYKDGTNELTMEKPAVAPAWCPLRKKRAQGKI